MDLILILLIVSFSSITGIVIRANYKTYNKIKCQKKMTGYDVARKILDENNLTNILIVETKGELSDHYDPKRKVVRLSTAVYHQETISAVSIAAHETGHAIQDKEGNAYMKFRSAFVPIVNICSSVSYIVLLIGFISEIADFVYLGILLMAAGLIFQLVTLPVEFGASQKAKKMLEKYKIITGEEKKGVNKVLNSAAMTYVAGTLATALQMLRLLLIVNNRRD